ncbi:MAG: hypothetical protein WDO18_08045 [Acidobacteriota bacterium]
MSLYSNLVSGGVSLTRVFELFDTTPEVVERSLTRSSVPAAERSNAATCRSPTTAIRS